MKIVYVPFGLEMDLTTDRPIVLSIESPSVYADFLQSVWEATESSTDQISLLDKGEVITVSKNLCLILNPLYIDCNERKILNKVYDELKDVANTEIPDKIARINSDLVNFLDELIDKVPYALQMNLSMDLNVVLKGFDIKFDTANQSLLEKMVAYIRLQHIVNHIDCYILVGIKEFFSREELRNLYKQMEYEQVCLVILEGNCYPVEECEKNIIIDADQCIIQL